MTVFKHIRAILILPGTVTLIIPTLILYVTSTAKIAWAAPLTPVTLLAGLFLVSLGLVLWAKTIRLFIEIGRGTLAPWDPTQKLVVHSVYRYVRNPMITGICCILLGETLVFGSRPLFLWFLIFLIVNLIYTPLSEEPGLERRFGDDYRLYKQHVPRWIPRLSPWPGPPNFRTESQPPTPPQKPAKSE